MSAYCEDCSNLSFAAWQAITGDHSHKELELELQVWYMGTISSEYYAASFVRAESRTAGSSIALVPIYPAASRWILMQLTHVRPTQGDDKGTANRVGLRRLDRGNKLVPATAHEFRCSGDWRLVSEWEACRKARENCHNTFRTFGESNL
jgi:hypothetical protein